MAELLLSKFTQKGAMELLLLLLSGERKATELTRAIYQQTAYRAISVLLQLKLVSVKKGFGNTKIYFLTPKGRKVAEKLTEIEAILKESESYE